MAPLTSRRDFIFNTGKAGLGLYVGSTILSSCSSAKIISGKNHTGFQQTPLPYSYNALNEAIDGTTMEIHEIHRGRLIDHMQQRTIDLAAVWRPATNRLVSDFLVAIKRAAA